MTKPFFSRREASERLKELGLPVAIATLAKYATTGGGPKYHKFGRLVRYKQDDLQEWALSKLSPPLSSSADEVRIRKNSRDG